MAGTIPVQSGLELLSARIDSIAGQLVHLYDSFTQRSGRAPALTRLTVTGLGSSEAQARYLVALCHRYSPLEARFIPLVEFGQAEPQVGDTLVVFSQGLSRNTRLALDSRHSFRHRVLFTSASEAGLLASGKPDRARLLVDWIEDGAEVVRFPIEDEYTILIRVVGPACGFLAAHLWLGSLPGNFLPEWTKGQLVHWIQSLQPPVHWFESQCLSANPGFVFLVPPLLAVTGYNIACKFVEGLFWSAPHIVDYLSFAHGPFQQLSANPQPVLLFEGASDFERDLADRAAAMCVSVGLKFHRLVVPGCPSLSPLLAELALNPVLVALARRFHIEQLDWPGKGLDQPLYAYP